MSPNQWGPQVWKLFHVLAETVHESEYSSLKASLFSYIRNICANLPCPDCASHATTMLSQTNSAQYDTKTGLIQTIYLFHNAVNKSLGKPLFKKENLAIYKTMHIVPVVKNFSIIFTQSTKGNMKLINQTYHRTILTQHFIRWINMNISKFLPIPPPIPIPPETVEPAEQPMEETIEEPVEEEETVEEPVEEPVEETI